MAQQILAIVSPRFLTNLERHKTPRANGKLWRKTFFLKSRGQEQKWLVSHCPYATYVVHAQVWTSVDKIYADNIVSHYAAYIYKKIGQKLVHGIRGSFL